MLSVSKEPNHPDSGSCLHAGARRIPHQDRCGMDSGNLAGAAHYRHHRYSHYNRHPHLEAQA